MDSEKKEFLKAFFQQCYDRLEMGEDVGGDRYKSADLFYEITCELADISNYAFLEYVKVMKLKNKVEKACKNNE